jgi:DNA-directed RNA polymerase subunit omega
MQDMLSLLPEGADAKFDSRHRMVIAASQRAKYLIQGGRPTTPSKFKKETTVALEEVLHGQVEYLVGKDARQAMKEAKRVRETEIARGPLPEAVAEDAREIKKELSVYVDDTPKAPASPEGEAEE